jgi:molecular chaperone GrpE (heat shock protein)
MNVRERLHELEPTAPREEAHDDSAATDMLKVLARIERAQARTEQAASFSANAVEEHLDEQKELIDAIKRERNRAQEKNETLTRFLLEIMDLIVQFEETTDPDTEAGRAARDMHDKLEQEMKKVGLARIPTRGEEPDTFYHYVANARPAQDGEASGTIAEEVRPGYVLDGTVIRKADVVVAQ